MTIPEGMTPEQRIDQLEKSLHLSVDMNEAFLKAVKTRTLDPWQYSDEGLANGIRVAKEGGRRNIDEGTTEEIRLIRLLRLVERSAFEAGQSDIRNRIKSALGIVP